MQRNGEEGVGKGFSNARMHIENQGVRERKSELQVQVLGGQRYLILSYDLN